MKQAGDTADLFSLAGPKVGDRVHVKRLVTEEYAVCAAESLSGQRGVVEERKDVAGSAGDWWLSLDEAERWIARPRPLRLPDAQAASLEQDAVPVRARESDGPFGVGAMVLHGDFP